MNIDEQDTAIIRLVKQRHEAKKRKVLLQNELRTAGRSLWDIGSRLKSVDADGPSQDSPEAALSEISKAPPICQLEQIKAMLDELKDLQAILTALNRSALELGID